MSSAKDKKPQYLPPAKGKYHIKTSPTKDKTAKIEYGNFI